MSKENPKLIKNGGEGTNIGKFLRGLKDVAPEILNIASSVTGIEALKVLGDKIKGSDSISEQDKIIALEILKIDMTIGVFGFSALIVLLLFFVKIPDQNRDVINFILGVVVGTGLTGIFNYFYGSSQGSKDKMNLIK